MGSADARRRPFKGQGEIFRVMVYRAMRRIVLALSLVLAGVAALAFFGFCPKTFRFPSKEEKIRQAVAYVVGSQASFHEKVKGKSPTAYDADLAAEVDVFLRQNPGCCRIGPEGGDGYPYPTLWLRVNGLISAIVVVEVPGAYRADGIGRVHQLAVSNCGYVW
jgi:hypothetical protein